MTTLKKKRIINRIAQFKDAKVFFIATEGQKTEHSYFEMIREWKRDEKIFIEILPSSGGRSNPEEILRNLNQLKEKYEFDENTDEFWLVLDRDTWQEGTLSDVAREAFSKRYDLAISNPCFECWLHFHFSEIDPSHTTCRKMTASLKKVSNGYTKPKINWEKYQSKIAAAVDRARKNDIANQDTENRWPLKPGTHVYKVVEKIIRGQ